MSGNELQPIENVSVPSTTHIKATEYGIEFDGSPDIEEWFRAVEASSKLERMTQFFLGDLMVYAESPTTGWGDSKYKELLELTDYDYGALRNMASVARRFDINFRRAVLDQNVSPRGDTFKQVRFSHFKAVEGVDDNAAKYMLQMVRDAGWSIRKLEENVKRLKNNGELPEPKQPIELPDGWLPFKELPREVRGYVPAPQRTDEYVPSYLLQIEEWELEKMYEDYKDDPQMVALCDRISTALGS